MYRYMKRINTVFYSLSEYENKKNNDLISSHVNFQNIWLSQVIFIPYFDDVDTATILQYMMAKKINIVVIFFRFIRQFSSFTFTHSHNRVLYMNIYDCVICQKVIEAMKINLFSKFIFHSKWFFTILFLPHFYLYIHIQNTNSNTHTHTVAVSQSVPHIQLNHSSNSRKKSILFQPAIHPSIQVHSYTIPSNTLKKGYTERNWNKDIFNSVFNVYT